MTSAEVQLHSSRVTDEPEKILGSILARRELTIALPLSAEDVETPYTSKDTTRASTPARDPHQLPDLSSLSPPSPILYLPPLLSSLPSGYPAPPPGLLPYATATRLPNIDPASLALHRALHNFHVASPEYARLPYMEAFNWNELELPEDIEREWYCVVFRSKRREGSDGGPLYEADRKAHEEAVQNGGLIMYWYGTPHPATGLNLATCIWQSRAHAIAANSRPHHIRAMRLAAASYERYDLERHRLWKLRGERNIRVDPYDGGDVGW